MHKNTFKQMLIFNQWINLHFALEYRNITLHSCISKIDILNTFIYSFYLDFKLSAIIFFSKTSFRKLLINLFNFYSLTLQNHKLLQSHTQLWIKTLEASLPSPFPLSPVNPTDVPLLTSLHHLWLYPSLKLPVVPLFPLCSLPLSTRGHMLLSFFSLSRHFLWIPLTFCC